MANRQRQDLAHWYVTVSRIIREIRKKALDAQKTLSKTAVSAVKDYLKTDLQMLRDAWPKNLGADEMGNLARHTHFAQAVDFREILQFDLPAIKKSAHCDFA